MQIRDWVNILRGRPALSTAPSYPGSRAEASLAISETAAPGREAATAHFFAAFVDPSGEPIDFPGTGSVLTITRDSVNRIRKSDDFLDQLRSSSSDYSQSFTLCFEFDVYPQLMMWIPKARGCDLAVFYFNSFSLDDNGAPFERAPCMLLFCDDDCLPDQDATNIISGTWEIDDVSEVLARYHQRPLALIISVGPGDPLSAAALTFAGARYLFGLVVPTTFAKAQDDA